MNGVLGDRNYNPYNQPKAAPLKGRFWFIGRNIPGIPRMAP
jgi:hypothetical protein